MNQNDPLRKQLLDAHQWKDHGDVSGPHNAECFDSMIEMAVEVIGSHVEALRISDDAYGSAATDERNAVLDEIERRMNLIDADDLPAFLEIIEDMRNLKPDGIHGGEVWVGGKKIGEQG
jgi:hypothetical protein